MFIRLRLHQSHYKLTAVDLSGQKEWNADTKAFQQIEFVGQLKHLRNSTVANESMFVLTVSEKILKTRLKFSQGCVTVLWKMENYKEVKVKQIKHG